MLADLEPLSRTTGAYAFAVLLGLLWGSFANVCIYRMPPTDEHPSGRSVVAPGSHCFACGKPVAWYDNVPLLSYLWLRGKCRNCKAPFSARYLLVEALTGVLFGVAWWFAMANFGETFQTHLIRFGIDAAFITVLVVIAFIDIDHMLILNKVTIPSIIVFYGLTFLIPEATWYRGLIGAAVGYGVPWTIGWVYLRITGREGMGLGDSTLLALIGALLGWKGVVASLFGGSMVGSVLGLTQILVRKLTGPASEPEPEHAAANDNVDPESDDHDDDEPSLLRTELPFGPYLVVAALFYLFAEPWIVLNFG